MFFRTFKNNKFDQIHVGPSNNFHKLVCSGVCLYVSVYGLESLVTREKYFCRKWLGLWWQSSEAKVHDTQIHDKLYKKCYFRNSIWKISMTSALSTVFNSGQNWHFYHYLREINSSPSCWLFHYWVYIQWINFINHFLHFCLIVKICFYFWSVDKIWQGGGMISIPILWGK